MNDNSHIWHTPPDELVQVADDDWFTRFFWGLFSIIMFLIIAYAAWLVFK